MVKPCRRTICRTTLCLNGDERAADVGTPTLWLWRSRIIRRGPSRGAVRRCKSEVLHRRQPVMSRHHPDTTSRPTGRWSTQRPTSDNGEVSIGEQRSSSSRPANRDATQDAAMFYGQIEDWKAVVRGIERSQTEDLRLPLATRGHFERLIEQYWELKCEQQRGQTESQTDGQPHRSSALQSDSGSSSSPTIEQLRNRILHHPYAHASPLMLRWPLPAAVVPRTRWSLADEVAAIVSRETRQRGRRSDDYSDEGSKDDVEDAVPPSLLLPVITRCQAALTSVLHDITHRIPPGGGQSKVGRKDIVNWRDVLKTIAAQPQTPFPALAATEARLQAIFGASKCVPTAATVSNSGSGSSGRGDGLMATIRSGDPVQLTRTESVEEGTAKCVRKRQFEERCLIDEEIMLQPPVRRSHRYFEKPPVKSRPQRTRRTRQEQMR